MHSSKEGNNKEFLISLCGTHEKYSAFYLSWSTVIFFSSVYLYLCCGIVVPTRNWKSWVQVPFQEQVVQLVYCIQYLNLPNFTLVLRASRIQPFCHVLLPSRCSIHLSKSSAVAKHLAIHDKWAVFSFVDRKVTRLALHTCNFAFCPIPELFRFSIHPKVLYFLFLVMMCPLFYPIFLPSFFHFWLTWSGLKPLVHSFQYCPQSRSQAVVFHITFQFSLGIQRIESGNFFMQSMCFITELWSVSFHLSRIHWLVVSN